MIAGVAGACVGIFPMDGADGARAGRERLFVSLAGSVALATLWMGGPRLPRTGLATVLGVITVVASAGYFVIYSVEGPGPGGRGRTQRAAPRLCARHDGRMDRAHRDHGLGQRRSADHVANGNERLDAGYRGPTVECRTWLKA